MIEELKPTTNGHLVKEKLPQYTICICLRMIAVLAFRSLENNYFNVFKEQANHLITL